MRLFAIVLLLAGLGAGLAGAYLAYRQLSTKVVAIEAAAQLQPDGQGADCGEVRFTVDARTLGRWLLPVHEQQTIAGTATVDGSKSEDIGFRIWSPMNRLVYNQPERRHVQEFNIVAPVSGDYTFEFDNRHSAFAKKTIVLSVCVS